MDPSSGQDKDSNEPENPFIRFKNFADSQVSSLLQGIIGLPSAISRQSSEHNRWADIDEDLRRRDELQARQRAFESQWKEAAGKAGGNPAVSGEVPVKKSSHNQTSQTTEYDSHWQKLVNGKESLTGDNKDNLKSAQDLPLYSPVRKELFNNFSLEDAVPALLSSFPGFRGHEFGLSPPTSDSTALVKWLSLTALGISTTLHSEYSLLPYLLFSPYSPIKLEVDARMSVNRQSNKVRYCAAFEDLVRTSQGRGGSLESRRDAERLSNSLFNAPGQDHWSWIWFLSRDGILQQKRKDSDPTPDLRAWRAIGSPGSDLDMFEHVQSIPPPFGGLFNRNYQGSVDEMEALRPFQLGATRDLQDLPPRPKPFTEDDPERNGGAAAEFKKANDGSPTEKVVATSTTTHQWTRQDGAVETSLTIWKQFEDGRASTTTTHHFAEPAWPDRESSWSHEDASEQEEKQSEKDQKKEKKGWFWN